MLLILSLTLALKKQFTKHINGGKVKQINIKNRTYYFYYDEINLKDFYARLLKVGKKDYKEIDIYHIGYVTVKKLLIATVLAV